MRMLRPDHHEPHSRHAQGEQQDFYDEAPFNDPTNPVEVARIQSA